MTEQERVDACCKDIRRVEQKIDALDRLVTAQFKDRDVTVQDLAKVMEKRLDSMNEFRGVLSEQAAEFLTKTSYELAHSGLVRDVDQIRDTMATKPEMASMIARIERVQLDLAAWSARVLTAGAIFTALVGLGTFFISRMFDH